MAHYTASLETPRPLPPGFRQPVDALAAALPTARRALVPGGHLIDPAGSEVRAFIEEVLTEASS